MKKILTILALVGVSSSAFAHGWEHGGYHGGYGGYPHGGYYGGYRHYDYHYNTYDPLVPLIIGGTIGYMINEANRQPQVIYQQPSTTVYQKCTAWVETIDQYGNVTRTRTCY